jgi:hypothetical protein
MNPSTERPVRALGKKRWAIAEGYIPAWSNGPEPEMLSHECVCFLNTGEVAAQVQLFIFFKDREPAGPYQFEVGARRTLHVRFNDLQTPEPVPLKTDFSCLIESSVPIVVQHTRLDSRQAANAIMTTIAYSEND